MHVQACRLPPPAGPVATCLMATLWGSCLTLEGLFQASALGQPPGQGNAWLQRHVGGRLMQEAATIARIAAELHRLVDQPSQEVPIPLLSLGGVFWNADDPDHLFQICLRVDLLEAIRHRLQAFPRSTQAMKHICHAVVPYEAWLPHTLISCSCGVVRKCVRT